MATAKLTKATKFEVIGSNGTVIAVFKVKSLKRAKRAKADKVVTVENIKSYWENEHFNAEINLTQKTIRIYGTVNRTERVQGILTDGTIGYISQVKPVEFSRTFGLNDTVEYASYNLRYTAPITNITKSYVEVHPRGYSKKTRLNLYTFCSRNWNLDLDQIAKENLETSYYI